MGGMMGELSSLEAWQLGAVAIKTAVARAGIPPEAVDEVFMGNVLMAGQGQAPARQASLGAGLPKSAGCVTLNKVCGSGMKSIMFAHDTLLGGTADVIVAGGMESMSNAPYLLKKARGGYRYGHDKIYDHMALDGLEDAYERGTAMGVFAERAVAKYGFTRAAQDAFAVESLRRSAQATADGSFAFEMAPVTVHDKKGDVVVDKDEGPLKARPEKIPTLRPAFQKDGTVTAASSASISDGAAALVLMRASEAKKRGIQPLARIVAHAQHARLPEEFTLAPVHAIDKVLGRAGWTTKDVDLWEINEAFACVTMIAIHDCKLDPAKVNVYGGACALGHPIGCSGARLVCTLIGALHNTHGKRGVASLCIGGGEATAVAIEML
ncbi:MAG: acetyl-CoA C-acyltransferase [Nevskiaceae bacterium]|nr:MAG: acetyl-CoA C-acyltransferase [Nevskiaceae bacterium]TBR72078.1 MAG: acetyl-CoA C-acyltransferase [Nevskiaceae bacterium]